VGRLRYIGLMLYDADAVAEAAAVERETDLYESQRSVFLDPHDPAVVAAARDAGIPDDWIDAAQRSPIWDLIVRYQVALPLHPEYRTMPMVWYIPPLSPVVDVLRDTGHDGEDAGNLFAAVDALRIPVDYLAGLFTAGDPEPVRAVLGRLAAMRAYQRRINLGESRDETIAGAVGMTGREMEDMYRLLAIAKYDDRYVIPAAHAENAHRLEQLGTECPVGGGGGPFGGSSGRPVPVQIETYRAQLDRQTADDEGEL
jgi:nitrate reductase beta subunit